MREIRVHQATIVVHRDVPQNLDVSGLGVDLDFRGVTATGKCERRILAKRHSIETVVSADRELRRPRGSGDIQEGDRAFAVVQYERSVPVLQIGRIGLQHLRSDGPGLLKHLFDCQSQRAAAHVHGARAAMAESPLGDARIRLEVAKRVERQTQTFGCDLRERGFVTLPIGLGARHEFDLAILRKAYLNLFLWSAARAFQEAGEAKTPKPSAACRFSPSLRKSVAIGNSRGVFDVGPEAPTVEYRAQRLAIWKIIDGIPEPKLDGIEPMSPCRGVNQTLDDVVRFGLPGPTIGVDGRRVGKRATALHVDFGNVIEAAHRRRCSIGRGVGARARGIGADEQGRPEEVGGKERKRDRHAEEHEQAHDPEQQDHGGVPFHRSEPRFGSRIEFFGHQRAGPAQPQQL